jgi:hypothetical protein
MSFTFMDSFLYALTDKGAFTGDNLDVNTRNAQWFLGSIGYDVLDYLTVAIGASTLYGQLQPDGKNRTPIFNRTTQIFLSLQLGIDPLVGKFL